MWKWDQGRLDYFQFDVLRKIARFAQSGPIDLRNADHAALLAATGLPFSPEIKGYLPWRNYSRVFRLSMICVEDGSGSRATPLAERLAEDGAITTDEYFHFLAESATDPSPALEGWDSSAALRYPLLFALKFLLARAAMGLTETNISEILASYEAGGFIGDEDQNGYIALINAGHDNQKLDRQAAESIRVICQISYLSLSKRIVTVSLSKDDAANLFEQLNPIGGTPQASGSDEVFRLTELFGQAVDELELDYATTAISDVEEAGFSAAITYAEGGKARKTHLVIERNGKMRSAYFKAKPSSSCEFCAIDTSKSYPWTNRILDLHHLLPLCSGARTSKSGTLLDDLVAVCPTCHRGIHRYYDNWLTSKKQRDFHDADQAIEVYFEAKAKHKAAV
jgi:hypothetical protein